MADHYEVEFPKSLGDLVKSCEIHCVAGCCGLEAFEFSREQVLKWLLDHPRQESAVREQLDQLIDRIRLVAEPEVSSMMLNAWWLRDDAVKFFLSIRKFLEHGR